MSGEPPPPTGAAPLQFDTVEGAPAQSACVICSTPLIDEYHELNGHTVCADCRAREEAGHAASASAARLGSAAAYGFGAAVLAGLGYWIFMRVTGIELGLAAIAAGWFVGRAVMKGSHHRGGRRFQILAVALTYVALSFGYGPLLIEEAVKNNAKKDQEKKDQEKKAAPLAETRPPDSFLVGVAMLLAVSLITPALVGWSSFLSLLIMLIGLWEAWRQTRAAPFLTGGPYRIGAERSPGA